jgi:ATP-dependent Clp protease adaptor protein ClpS
MAEFLVQPDIERDIERDEQTEETEENKWKVIIHNDEVTPFDFVIAILIRIFNLTPVIAEYITYSAHTNGIALVAVLPKTEAERKVGKAHFAARLEGYPLTFTIEPDE